jgi:hypothetical protein
MRRDQFLRSAAVVSGHLLLDIYYHILYVMERVSRGEAMDSRSAGTIPGTFSVHCRWPTWSIALINRWNADHSDRRSLRITAKRNQFVDSHDEIDLDTGAQI